MLISSLFEISNILLRQCLSEHLMVPRRTKYRYLPKHPWMCATRTVHRQHPQISIHIHAAHAQTRARVYMSHRFTSALLCTQLGNKRTGSRLRGKVGSFSLSLSLSLFSLSLPLSLSLTHTLSLSPNSILSQIYIFITKLLYSISRRGARGRVETRSRRKSRSNTFAGTRCHRRNRVFRYPAKKMPTEQIFTTYSIYVRPEKIGALRYFYI